MKREDWYKLLRRDLAYTAKEIALLMGKNIVTARRHIQRAVAYGVLVERRKGCVKLYALADAVEESRRVRNRRKPVSEREVEE